MSCKTLITAAIVAAAAFSSAHAGVIVGPTSATANVDSASGYSLSFTYDQSGLSANYISGVTDFDTFVAGATHSNDSNVIWSGKNNAPQAEITYGLGGVFDLESFALWNRGNSVQGIKDFELIFSETADFAQTTTVSNYIATADLGAIGATLAEVFTFSTIRAGFVKLNILSTYNTSGIITFGEAAFEGSAVSEVPLPAALPLFLLGLTAIGFGKRRQQGTSVRR